MAWYLLIVAHRLIKATATYGGKGRGLPQNINMNITLDGLIAELRQKVEQGQPIAPSQYLDYAANINLLILDLDEELVKAECAINEATSKRILEGENVSAAKVHVKASSEYRNYLTLKAKRERVGELVRIAKKRVELARWDQ